MTSEQNPAGTPVRRRMAGYTPLRQQPETHAAAPEAAPAPVEAPQQPQSPDTPAPAVEQTAPVQSAQSAPVAADTPATPAPEVQAPAASAAAAPAAPAVPARKRRMGSAPAPLQTTGTTPAPTSGTAVPTASSPTGQALAAAPADTTAQASGAPVQEDAAAAAPAASTPAATPGATAPAAPAAPAVPTTKRRMGSAPAPLAAASAAAEPSAPTAEAPAGAAAVAGADAPGATAAPAAPVTPAAGAPKRRMGSAPSAAPAPAAAPQAGQAPAAGQPASGQQAAGQQAAGQSAAAPKKRMGGAPSSTPAAAATPATAPAGQPAAPAGQSTSPAAGQAPAPVPAAQPAASTAATTRIATPRAQSAQPASGRAGTPGPAGAATPKKPERPWVKPAVIIGALVVLAVLVVLGARWLRTLEGVQEFIATYDGHSTQLEAAPEGMPWWMGWQHFFNMFLMVLIIRTGLQVRHERKPPGYWTAKKGSFFSPKGNTPKKVSLTQWLHQSLDVLWVVNGLVFVILLFATGHWMRIVPTDWDVFPNMVSGAIQYASLDWPTENGWVHYNALQTMAYGVTVFIAAPLAIISGLRFSTWWPDNAEKLNKVYPVEWARAVHFPVMLYFVGFIVVHVFLVFFTGALRNLNHMYTSRDVVDWWGLVIFLVSLVVIAAAWFLSKPMFTSPIASQMGKISK